MDSATKDSSSQTTFESPQWSDLTVAEPSPSSGVASNGSPVSSAHTATDYRTSQWRTDNGERVNDANSSPVSVRSSPLKQDFRQRPPASLTAEPVPNLSVPGYSNIKGTIVATDQAEDFNEENQHFVDAYSHSRSASPRSPRRSIQIVGSTEISDPDETYTQAVPTGPIGSVNEDPDDTGDGLLEALSSHSINNMTHTPYVEPVDEYQLAGFNDIPQTVPERKPHIVHEEISDYNGRPLSQHLAQAQTSDYATTSYQHRSSYGGSSFGGSSFGSSAFGSGSLSGSMSGSGVRSSTYSPSPRLSPSMSPSVASRMYPPGALGPNSYNGSNSRPMSTMSMSGMSGGYALDQSSSINLAANRMSHYDLTSSSLVPHLGEHAGNLMPRIKTIDLYRRNAKKSRDPVIEFQLAQYMVQTALLNTADTSTDAASSNNSHISQEQSPRMYNSGRLDSLAEIPNPEATANDANPAVGSDAMSPADSATIVSTSDQNIDEAKLKKSLLKEALGMLRRLSDRGLPDAQYLLGDIYSSTAVGGKPDLEKSAKYFLMAAKHQHAEASYRAALCTQEGWGVPRDASRTLRLFKAAAVKNQPGALYHLGMAYFHGHLGISDNSNNRLAGIKWLTRAVSVANDIYNKAPYELGKIYEVGYHDIVIPDKAYAARLYARSAELNFIPAAAKLGHAYEFGELGCPQDPSLSIHYYTIAALGNNPTAQLSLGAWYMVGAGPQFPANEDEAYEWVLRSALNGLPKGMYTIGFFFENGIGCERDLIASTKWYRRAANAGEQRAVAKLSRPEVKEQLKSKDKCVVM